MKYAPLLGDFPVALNHREPGSKFCTLSGLTVCPGSFPPPGSILTDCPSLRAHIKPLQSCEVGASLRTVGKADFWIDCKSPVPSVLLTHTALMFLVTALKVVNPLGRKPVVEVLLMA